MHLYWILLRKNNTFSTFRSKTRVVYIKIQAQQAVHSADLNVLIYGKKYSMPCRRSCHLRVTGWGWITLRPMAGQTNFYSQLLISAIWIVDINNSNCWYQQFELEISTIIIADITNSKWITDISSWNCWYHKFKLLISLIIMLISTIVTQLLISAIWIADINNCVTTVDISNYN